MLKISNVLVGFGLLLATATTSQAGMSAATFDFENEPVTGSSGLTALNVEENGLTATFDRMGQPFDIANISSLANAGTFGQRTLSPTPPGGNAFEVSFSEPVSSFSVEFGDSTASGADALKLVAFAGLKSTGLQIGVTTGVLPLNPSNALAFQTLQISGAGIKSVEFIGGTADAPNSVFYDNLHVSGFSGTTTGGSGGSGGGTASVPLPPAIYVMPFCGILVWLGMRKNRPAFARS